MTTTKSKTLKPNNLPVVKLTASSSGTENSENSENSDALDDLKK